VRLSTLSRSTSGSLEDKTTSTYLGDILDEHVFKVPLPGKELGEVLALGRGSDSTPHAIPSLEECPDGLAKGA
jgi:hypothetical protein